MSKIEFIIIDVDGTLTDGKINISSQGELFKSFDVKDGMAIGLALDNNIQPIVITGRISEIVTNRCKELGIEYVFQGVHNKIDVLNTFLMSNNKNLECVAAIGDDINDLDVLNSVSISGCPSDAVQSVKEACSYICNNRGGKGAVREFIEYIFLLNGTDFSFKKDLSK